MRWRLIMKAAWKLRMKIDRKAKGTKECVALELQSFRREKFVLSVRKRERSCKTLRKDKSSYSSSG